MGVSGSTTNAFGTGTTTLTSGITVRSNTNTGGKSVLVLETGAGAPGTGTLGQTRPPARSELHPPKGNILRGP